MPTSLPCGFSQELDWGSSVCCFLCLLSLDDGVGHISARGRWSSSPVTLRFRFVWYSLPARVSPRSRRVTGCEGGSRCSGSGGRGRRGAGEGHPSRRVPPRSPRIPGVEGRGGRRRRRQRGAVSEVGGVSPVKKQTKNKDCLSVLERVPSTRREAEAVGRHSGGSGVRVSGPRPPTQSDRT